MSTTRVTSDKSATRAKSAGIKTSKKDKVIVVLDNVPVPPRPKHDALSKSIKRKV